MWRRPLLLCKEIDRQVKEYLKYLREQGSAVNMVIAITTAEGVVRSVDTNLVACKWWYVCVKPSSY